MQKHTSENLLVLSMVILLLISSYSEGGRDPGEVEIGDAIYRSGFVWLGHVGLITYTRMFDDYSTETSYAIESDGDIGVHTLPFDEFYEDVPSWGSYWGAYKHPNTATFSERKLLISSAFAKEGYGYHFWWGYKDHHRFWWRKFYRTYRCDGLVEDMYEYYINHDIVNDADWWELAPAWQKDEMTPAVSIVPIVYFSITSSDDAITSKIFLEESVTVQGTFRDDHSGVQCAKVYCITPEQNSEDIMNFDWPDEIPPDNERTKDVTCCFQPQQEGIHTVSAKAWDWAGNVNEYDTEIEVKDPKPTDIAFSDVWATALTVEWTNNIWPERQSTSYFELWRKQGDTPGTPPDGYTRIKDDIGGVIVVVVMRII